MVKNIAPTGFQMIFSLNQGPTGNQIGPTMYGYVPVSIDIITALFVKFYESHVPWLRQTFGNERKKWPPIFYFARNLRNFLVHHGGKVHFERPNDPPAAWHHFTYSPADDGQPAVAPNHIYLGEMIILLVELSDELDRLSCPKP